MRLVLEIHNTRGLRLRVEEFHHVKLEKGAVAVWASVTRRPASSAAKALHHTIKLDPDVC